MSALADELFAKSLEHKAKQDANEYNDLIIKIKESAKAMTRGETTLTFQQQFSECTLNRLRTEDKFIVEEKHYKGRSGCGCDYGCSVCSSTFSTVISWDRSKKEAKEAPKSAAPADPVPEGFKFPKCAVCKSVVGHPVETEFTGVCVCSMACASRYRNYGAFEGGKRPEVTKPAAPGGAPDIGFVDYMDR